VLGVGVLSAFLLSGCGSDADVWKGQPDKPRVVVTFPPLYSFVKKVGGDRVGVYSLCKETGPHNYEYNQRDAMAVRKAHLFLALGLTLDDKDKFAPRIVANCGNPNIRFTKLGEQPKVKDFVTKIPGEDDVDPHLWLGLGTASNNDPTKPDGPAQALVLAIADELAAVDPDGAATYRENAKKYAEELTKLRDEYRTKLEKAKAVEEANKAAAKAAEALAKAEAALKENKDDAKKKDLEKAVAEAKEAKDRADKAVKDAEKGIRILPMHDALYYFGRSFGLKIEPAIEEIPGDTPGTQRMQKLVKECDDKKIRVIAIEPQFEEKPAKELEKKLKDKKLEVKLILIDPLESISQDEETKKPDVLDENWYVKKMRQNLDRLVDAELDKLK
jgi:ABC-type Zn uptake system ZnuABC Zn-binding protein ZnuA